MITIKDMQGRKDEAGIVSLMVTLVMLIVITLIVLGFAEIARNEQRSSLDDQLSAQAYYAAESGINDVRPILNSLVAAGQNADKTTCGNQGAYTLNNTVDTAHNVSYTCVLIDTAPKTLTYTAGYDSTVVPIISAGPNFSTLSLAWHPAANACNPQTANCASGCFALGASPQQNPPAGQWTCSYPELRIDLVDASGLARSSWAAKTTTVFLVPFNSTAVSNTVALGAHGTAVPASCDTNKCTVSITGLSGTQYYLRLTTLYRDNSQVAIQAGGGIGMTKAQAIIDATGKAQDVLRRVVVAVDLTDANAHSKPSAAIVSRDSVCKRFAITNGSFNVYDDLSAGGDANTLCSLAASGTPTP